VFRESANLRGSDPLDTKECKWLVYVGLKEGHRTWNSNARRTGPFLGSLGASATVVGIVAGSGELLGYSLRSVAGYLLIRRSGTG